mgnify:CR=1 FL=1
MKEQKSMASSLKQPFPPLVLATILRQNVSMFVSAVVILLNMMRRLSARCAGRKKSCLLKLNNWGERGYEKMAMHHMRVYS